MQKEGMKRRPIYEYPITQHRQESLNPDEEYDFHYHCLEKKLIKPKH